MISAAIYALCALTSLACCLMLFRSWLRTEASILFWSWLCFAGLTLGNVLLILDKLVFSLVDLRPARMLVVFISVSLLLYGLLWEDE
jgi:hypothetical protein